MTTKMVTSGNFTIRTTGDGDLAFLAQMLYEAAGGGYRPGFADQFPREQLLSSDLFRKYLGHWGRPGDSGVVAALPDATLIGAAWYRVFDPADPPGGMVDPSVPVLTIAVDADWRGRGVGTALLEALLERAAEEGHRRLSLGVFKDNARALALYRHLGFEIHAPRRDSYQMVVDVKQPWERALDTFLRPWKDRPEVVGALATGSYVFGTETPLSDVDVHIVLAPTVRWRERGNQMVDGFLIEYFANPPSQIVRYMEADFRAGRRADAHMFTAGKVVFDRDGEIERLKKVAAVWMKRPFPRTSRVWQEQRKYAIWDYLDTLRDLAARGDPSLPFVYSAALNLLLETYARFLRTDLPPLGKVHRLISDPGFARRYGTRPFPDTAFVALIEPCFAEPCFNEVSFARLESAAIYVQDAMGGFTIDGWKLRSKLEVATE